MIGPVFTINKSKKSKKYTIEEYLRAAEIGEVSLIDANHVTTLLKEARRAIKNGVSGREAD